MNKASSRSILLSFFLMLTLLLAAGGVGKVVAAEVVTIITPVNFTDSGNFTVTVDGVTYTVFYENNVLTVLCENETDFWNFMRSDWADQWRDITGAGFPSLSGTVVRTPWMHADVYGIYFRGYFDTYYTVDGWLNVSRECTLEAVDAFPSQASDDPGNIILDEYTILDGNTNAEPDSFPEIIVNRTNTMHMEGGASPGYGTVRLVLAADEPLTMSFSMAHVDYPEWFYFTVTNTVKKTTQITLSVDKLLYKSGESIKVHGRLVDDNNSPLAGYSIKIAVLDGDKTIATKATNTNASGYYDIEITAPNVELAKMLTIRASFEGIEQENTIYEPSNASVSVVVSIAKLPTSGNKTSVWALISALLAYGQEGGDLLASHLGIPTPIAVLLVVFAIIGALYWVVKKSWKLLVVAVFLALLLILLGRL